MTMVLDTSICGKTAYLAVVLNTQGSPGASAHLDCANETIITPALGLAMSRSSLHPGRFIRCPTARCRSRLGILLDRCPIREHTTLNHFALVSTRLRKLVYPASSPTSQPPRDSDTASLVEVFDISMPMGNSLCIWNCGP